LKARTNERLTTTTTTTRAQGMFNKWTSGKQDALRGSVSRSRPFHTHAAKDLNEADRWRSDVLRDVGRKVMEIQNAGLGEHKIRDLNDEINQLLKEKWQWEMRIIELGGPNYIASAPKVEDADGGAVQPPGTAGDRKAYKYFGAAKNLPGVKELFEAPVTKAVRRTRHQMNLHIDSGYYGFRDEEDGVLLKDEAEAEQQLQAAAIEQYETEQKLRELEGGGGTRKKASTVADAGRQFVAHVPLVDEADIEREVLNRKKQELLAKYVSEDLQAQEASAKTMLH
jgi:pre-mRNA-splicing factor ISY1|tara:strand:- start:10670 stop:11515 length:846 start_codon:yes stop_codon:yes gene_type:complete